MITFDRVTKVYKSGHVAIENLSFEIEAGEFVFLMGPSGSGKTTLLKLILRETEPSSGKIIVAEHNLDKIPRRQLPLFRRQIGSAFQDFKLIPDKSALENVGIALEIVGKKNRVIRSIAGELLERVGLKDKMHLFPAQLSGGEVQRVAIARAIASEPVLLFADEPTGNLDPQTSEEIVSLLRDIHAQGTTLIMSTHDVELADKFKHRQIILNKGTLEKDTKNPTVTEEASQESTTDSDTKDNQDKHKKKKHKS